MVCRRDILDDVGQSDRLQALTHWREKVRMIGSLATRSTLAEQLARWTRVDGVETPERPAPSGVMDVPGEQFHRVPLMELERVPLACGSISTPTTSNPARR